MSEQSRQLWKIQEQMRPGIVALLGFLGNDKRSLSEILQADEESVKRWGLSHKQLAMRMQELREAGLNGLGEFIHVPPYFEVRVDSVRGKLLCPFGDPGLHAKTNIVVRNLKSNRELTYTDLHIHLIGEHGFYEGKGFAYRLDPEDIILTLELVPTSIPDEPYIQ